jgi:hypothetical protein
MNDIASIRKIRPFAPVGAEGALTAGRPAVLLSALAALEAREAVTDFAVFRVKGKNKF